MSPLLAQSGHSCLHRTCPLLGVKWTCRFTVHMSAFDPKRTFRTAASSLVSCRIRSRPVFAIVKEWIERQSFIDGRKCGHHPCGSKQQNPAPNTPCVPAARNADVSTLQSFGCAMCPIASSPSWGTSSATQGTSTSSGCAGVQTRGNIRTGALLKLP